MIIATARNVLSAVTLLGLAAPAQARFLQADPVGYQDQFNLYVYLANDPVNRADPSGMTCTPVGTQRGGAPEFRCRMDFVSVRSNGEWTRRAPTEAEQNGRFRTFNSRYTGAVNTLARMDPERAASVRDLQGNSGGFTITAGEARQNLVGKTFVFMERGTNNANTVMGAPGLYNERTGAIDRNEVAVTNRTLSISARQIVHEGGMHGSRAEWTGGLQNSDYPLKDIEHQREYDRPACVLLGETNC